MIEDEGRKFTNGQGITVRPDVPFEELIEGVEMAFVRNFRYNIHEYLKTVKELPCEFTCCYQVSEEKNEKLYK